MSKEDVKLEIQVPKGVIDFLTDMLRFADRSATPKEFIEEEVRGIPECVISSLPSSLFNYDDIRERYGLKQKGDGE